MASEIKVFIAHASEDKEQIRRLYDSLARQGFKPWLDEIDLLPGQNWRVEIPKAIRESDIFLACLSRTSVAKSGYVQLEFRLALNTYAEKPPGSIFLIPVKLDDCNVPDIQLPELGVSLRDIQWLDLSKSNGFDRLVTAIKANRPQALSATTSGLTTAPPLRLILTRPPSYPTAEFSLVNRLHTPLQITSLLALPCAKIKFESRSIREIFGPRVRLSVDLRKAHSGSPLRVAGEDGIFNLGPGEAEAFRIQIASENTLNILCIEAEIVTADFPISQKISLDHAIFCAAASDRYAGGLAVVPKASLVEALLQAERDTSFWDILPEVPRGLARDACLRASAFLSDGKLDVWNSLQSLYGNKDDWGSIVASFAEYGVNYPCPASITAYIDEWLTSPKDIRQITIWDEEIRSVTVLDNRMAQLPKNERSPYLLKVLDSTLEIVDIDAYKTTDSDEWLYAHFKEMSLTFLRDRAAHLLAEMWGADAVEFLVAVLITSDGITNVTEILEEVTHAGIKQDRYRLPMNEAQDWIDWWKANSAKFPSENSWVEFAPLMARAFQARVAEASLHSQYLGDHPVVRKNLAGNNTLTVAELDVLVKDDVADVRLTIARRRSLPASIAQQLSQDRSIVVRRHLACNPGVDISILWKLLEDEDDRVRSNAEQTIKAVTSK